MSFLRCRFSRSEEEKTKQFSFILLPLFFSLFRNKLSPPEYVQKDGPASTHQKSMKMRINAKIWKMLLKISRTWPRIMWRKCKNSWNEAFSDSWFHIWTRVFKNMLQSGQHLCFENQLCISNADTRMAAIIQKIFKQWSFNFKMCKEDGCRMRRTTWECRPSSNVNFF